MNFVRFGNKLYKANEVRPLAVTTLKSKNMTEFTFLPAQKAKSNKMKIKQRPNFGTMPLVILGLVYIHTFLALPCSAIDKLVNNVNLSILSI